MCRGKPGQQHNYWPHAGPPRRDLEGASEGVAINPQEVDEMAPAIAWIFEALLRLNGHEANMVRAPHGMVMAR